MEIPKPAFGSILFKLDLEDLYIKAKKGTRTLNINLGKVILYHWAIFAFYFFKIKKEFNKVNNSKLFCELVCIDTSIGGIFLNFKNSVFN